MQFGRGMSWLSHRCGRFYWKWGVELGFERSTRKSAQIQCCRADRGGTGVGGAVRAESESPQQSTEGSGVRAIGNGEVGPQSDPYFVAGSDRVFLPGICHDLWGRGLAGIPETPGRTSGDEPGVYSGRARIALCLVWREFFLEGAPDVTSDPAKRETALGWDPGQARSLMSVLIFEIKEGRSWPTYLRKKHPPKRKPQFLTHAQLPTFP